MLKFGKRINYRPLVFSLFYGVLLFLITLIFSKPILSIFLGILLFLWILFGYYWRILPTMFNYWEVDEKTIKYSDMTNKGKKTLMLIAPFSVPMQSVKLDSIKSVTVTGNLGKFKEIPLAIPYTGYLAILTSIISVIRNPIDLTFTLKDGSSFNVSAARDFVWDRKNIVSKLDKLFKKLDDSDIQVVDKTDHALKFSY